MRSVPVRLGPLALLVLLPSCGADPPPPPVAPPVVVAPPPLPPLPPAPPPLLAVPRAEASPRNTAPLPDVSLPKLRSEGKRHALERTSYGVVMLSEERGVIGFVKHATPIRWAGFVEDDAVLAASGGTLLRAASPDDAVAGRFEPIGSVDPTATLLASSGKTIVAAAPEDGGVLLVSRDGGKRFVAEKRPAPGRIESVAARVDGIVVVAIEQERFKGPYGGNGVRAAAYVARGPGAWAKGPVGEAFYGPVLSQRGDDISIPVPKPDKDETRHEHTGLDTRGRWIVSRYAPSWLDFAYSGTHVGIGIPHERPGFPTPPKGDDMNGLLGILGGIASSRPQCRGAACLARRKPVSSVAMARAFHDGVCAKGDVVTRKETHQIMRGPGFRDSREETQIIRECGRDAPAARAPSLLLLGASQSLVKLPATCAAGRVVATDRAAFVACSSQHQSRPAILHVAPSGAITEVVPNAAPDLEVLGAESASDGTTLIFAEKVTWLCRTDAPSCTPLRHEGLLAARPVPGGRALVARRGESDHELSLELAGEPTAVPFKLTVQDNVLEMELTDQGFVRLWISPSLTAFEPQRSERYLVRTDGILTADR